MKLYIYDHCPYCVKARMIFGFKSHDITLVTLLNDDEATPTQMIGKKMVPILQEDDGRSMPESMDIVRYIDGADGAPLLLGPSGDSPLDDWLEESREYIYPLCMPRWADAPLEEFATASARAYFITKKEHMIGPFAEHLQCSPALIKYANEHLRKLEPLIASTEAVRGKALSEDDIHLFAALRSLSIVKGIVYPKRVEVYRQTISARAAVPLHDAIAL